VENVEMAKKTVESTEVDKGLVKEMEGKEDSGAYLPAQQGGMALGEVQGEINNSDLQLPRLKLTYGVGALAEFFTPGDIILADDNKLASKGEPIKLIILNATQFYKEYLTGEQFNAGQRPRVYMTEAEVIANGGTTRWNNGIGPSFSNAMNLKMLIKRPDDLVCGLFGVPVGDAEYAAAVWDIDKTAYKRVGPVVLAAANFSLRKRGLISGVFTLETKMEKTKNGNIVPVPILKLAEHNTDEEMEEIKSYFAPQPAPTPDAG
jgi:hypothetical protein